MAQTPTLILLPLDERPVNTRCPQMVGAIAGAQVQLPPDAVRGRQRDSADLAAVTAWLREAAPQAQAQAALISADYLGYGNLIQARISQDSVGDALARLRTLAEINAYCPVHAFSLITRVPDADDCVEEPDYWCIWGRKLAGYARLSHQAERDNLTAEERTRLSALEAEIPDDVKADWLTRRLRNHAVNLGLLDMAARGQLASLLLTSDDTAPFGFPSRERDWLRSWPRLIGAALADRVMMHPGADEVGSALVSRVLCAEAKIQPQVWIEWAVPGDEQLVAPYEDRPVQETVRGQLAACGCVLAMTPTEADFVLGVATPSPRRTDYRPEYLEPDRAARGPAYLHFLQRLADWQRAGKPVALADVAYPNGADPLLMEFLLSPDSLLRVPELCAYGAWNTAGNTLGVAIAQAACSLMIADHPERLAAQAAFLAHRFLEDWGYQTVTRRQAREQAQQEWARRDPDPESLDEQTYICAFVERGLRARLVDLQARGIGIGWQIASGSVTLPWRRLFEVDFVLEPAKS
jgi:hypothetical protein